MGDDLKLKTARTLKWNTLDRISSQVLYAVTGIVLANVLTKEEFGLVGAVMVFQAFASLFVDSGFSGALIQRKAPTDTDYSTVLYFNLGVSVLIYCILWLSAPLIDSLFNAGGALVPLARVMFLTFVLNATAIVQTNRLMKQMNVRMIAVSNAVGLVVSGATGIILALQGYGAWAIVWQSIVLSAVKSGLLWATSRWRPQATFSMASLRSIFAVGVGIMTSSFLNTVFQNIYSFIIGTYYNLANLGCYTQADKWSKMGVTSLSQTVTASFLPVLSGCQDDRPRFHRMMAKTNRFTAYVAMPCLVLLVLLSEAIFHTLFGTKWDEAIVLFQLLAARGIFVVLTSLYTTQITAIGAARKLVESEVVKDVLTVAAIIATIPFGIEWLVGGQVIAAAVCFVYSQWLVARTTGYRVAAMLTEIAPYAAITLISAIPAAAVAYFVPQLHPVAMILAQTVAFAVPYVAINAMLHSRIQHDVLSYALGRFTRKKSD
ncbi:MAG: lipopolysaccharide biosynthesis protein [Muribaculaceae bacterium]|nr:lipopolysaccharide biosynthesis protein [Muribaculaceae bacterium]